MAPLTGTGSRQQYLIDKRAYAANPVGVAPVAPPTNAPVTPAPSGVGSASYVPSTAPSTPGTGDWIGNNTPTPQSGAPGAALGTIGALLTPPPVVKPYVPPVGPTSANPVVVVGGPAPVIEPPKTDWADMTEQQKKDEIFLRGATTDAQKLWQRDNEINAGTQSATDEQTKYDAEKARLAGETEASIQAKSAEQAAQFADAQRRYKEAAAEQSNTQQRILDYRGTGESSFAVDTQRKISQAELDQENLLRQQQSLELTAYRKELQGADREALKPLYDRINQIKDLNAQLEYTKEKDKQALAQDKAQNEMKQNAPLTQNEILQAQLKIPVGSTFEINGKTYKGLGEKAVTALDVQKIVNDTPVGSTFTYNGQVYQGTKTPTVTYSTYTGKDGLYRVNKQTGIAELVQDKNGNSIQAPVSYQFHADPITGAITIFNPKTKGLETLSETEQTTPSGRPSGTPSDALQVPDKTQGGQCGAFVNDYTGLGLGDDYQSKADKMDPGLTSKDAAPGMVFLSKYKNSGHVGFIISVHGDTATVKDSNYSSNNDELVRTHDIKLSTITGLKDVSGITKESQQQDQLGLISQEAMNQLAGKPKIRDMALKIADDFDKHPTVVRFNKTQEAKDFVNSFDLNTNDPTIDQALIYAFAKAMDPDSAVRNEEYNTISKNSQTWFNQLGVNLQRVYDNASLLSIDARTKLVNMINNKYNSSLKSYSSLKKGYETKIENTVKPYVPSFKASSIMLDTATPNTPSNKTETKASTVTPERAAEFFDFFLNQNK